MKPQQQLQLIAEVVSVARHLDVAVWLRGGWAVDFFLGHVTRPHGDVDFFAWSDDADVLCAALTDRGFRPVTGPPADQQRDFAKGGEEVSFALLRMDDVGQPLVGGGPWGGTPFPEAAAHGSPGRIGDIECPIVAPQGQISIKVMTPVWRPDLRRRTKDAADISLLRAALSRAGAAEGSGPHRSLRSGYDEPEAP